MQMKFHYANGRVTKALYCAEVNFSYPYDGRCWKYVDSHIYKTYDEAYRALCKKAERMGQKAKLCKWRIWKYEEMTEEHYFNA